MPKRVLLHQLILAILIAGCGVGTYSVWPNLGDVPTPSAAVPGTNHSPVLVVLPHRVNHQDVYVLYLEPLSRPQDATLQIIYPWRIPEGATATVAINVSGDPPLACPSGFRRASEICTLSVSLPNRATLLDCTTSSHYTGGPVCLVSTPPKPATSAPGFADFAVTKLALSASDQQFDRLGLYVCKEVPINWPIGVLSATDAPFVRLEMPVVGVSPPGRTLASDTTVAVDSYPTWTYEHVDRVLYDDALNLTYLSGTGLPISEIGTAGSVLYRFPNYQSSAQLTLTFEDLDANQLNVNRAVLVGVLLAVGGAAIIALTESLVLSGAGWSRRAARRRPALPDTAATADGDPPEG